VYQLEEEPPFTLTDVYFQDWVAGVESGGSGTRLHLSVTSNAGNIRLMHAYFHEQKVRIDQNETDPDTYVVNFEKGMGKDRIMDLNAVNEAKNVPEEEFPFDLEENEAVLSYLIEGELKFYLIGPIVEKPMLAYPGVGEGEN